MNRNELQDEQEAIKKNLELARREVKKRADDYVIAKAAYRTAYAAAFLRFKAGTDEHPKPSDAVAKALAEIETEREFIKHLATDELLDSAKQARLDYRQEYSAWQTEVQMFKTDWDIHRSEA